MEQCKIYYCYKATNDVNGKVYIGFATDPQQRWREHKRDAESGRGYIFHDAIRKHGWEHFQFEIICCGRDKQSMLEHVEPALIEQYQSSIGKNGYNMHRKVMGASSRNLDARKKRGPLSKEHKQKIGAALKGNQFRVGCKDSEETRKRKSEVLKGNLRSLGRVQPPKIRREISEASQRMWDRRHKTGMNSFSKVTPDIVREIRSDYAKGGISQSQLGRKYGITQSSVGDIINFVTFKWVSENAGTID